MFADAVSSEAFKLRRNVRTSFFAWLFLPLLSLVIGLANELWIEEAMRTPRGGPILDFGPFDVGQALVSAMQPSAMSLLILFCLIGAAVLFAGEYRWETWRLMTPRNTRLNQLGGKILVYALASAASYLLFALASVATGLIGAAADGQQIRLGLDGEVLLQALGRFGVGWALLLQAGAIAALAGVATRSIMAALLVPLGLGIVQSILRAIAGAMAPGEIEWWQPWALPEMSADLLRAALSGAPPLPGMELSAGLVWTAGLALAAWIVVGFGGALALFNRQDLSKE